MDSAQAESAGRDAFNTLLEAAESQYNLWALGIRKEQDARYKELHHRRLDCMGRAAKRIEILEEFAARRIRARVEIHKNVAEKYRSKKMLSSFSLDKLRAEIADSVRLGCQSVKEMSESDCRACGEWDLSAMEALARRYPAVEAKLVALAKAELRVLEVEGELARQLQDPSVEKAAGGTGKSQHTSRSNEVRDLASPKKTRMQSTITSPIGARRMEAYIKSKGIGQTEFANQVGITDRTLRAFRNTGKVRRDIFEAIAKAMGTTRDALMKPE